MSTSGTQGAKGVKDRHNGTIPIVLCVVNLCNDLFTNSLCRDIDVELAPLFNCDCFLEHRH